jgi:hypothetical protein
MANKKFSQFTSAPTPNANSFFVGYNSVTNDNTRTSLSDLITAIGAPSGSGTTNYVTKWVSGSAVGNSLFYSDANVAKTIYGGNEKGLKLDFANNEASFNNNNNIGIFSFAFGLYLGDWGGYQNATTLQILDDTRVIKTNDGGNDKGLFIDFADNYYALGDGNLTNNGTTFIIDDANQIISTQNQGGYKGLGIDFASKTYQFWDGVRGLSVSNNDDECVLGDFTIDNTGTLLKINDVTQIIKTQNNSVDKGLYLDFANNLYQLGDSTIGTFLTIDTTNQVISTTFVGNDDGLKLDSINRDFYLGDFNSNNNGTYFNINDNDSIIRTVGYNNNIGLYLDFANVVYELKNAQQVGLNITNGYLTKLGDYTGNQYGYTYLTIDADASLIKTSNGGQDKGLKLDFGNSQYSFGEYDNANNGTRLLINDSGRIIQTISGQNEGLELNFTTKSYTLGDYDGSLNNTRLNLNDTNQIIKTSGVGLDKGLYLDFANDEYFIRYDNYGIRQSARQTYIGDLEYGDWGELLSINGNNGIISTQRGFIGDNKYKGLYINFANDTYALGFTETGDFLSEQVLGFAYQFGNFTMGDPAGLVYGNSITIDNSFSRFDIQTNRTRLRNLTTTQMYALENNEVGDMVFNTTISKICVFTYNGSEGDPPYQWLQVVMATI